jgi:collagenase-like PrtC family protease
VLDGGEEHTETLMFPSRQLSRIGDVAGYLAAGVGVLKLQGRSLPPRVLGPLVSRYRQAIDAALAGGSPPEPGESTLPSMWTVVGR